MHCDETHQSNVIIIPINRELIFVIVMKHALLVRRNKTLIDNLTGTAKITYTRFQWLHALVTSFVIPSSSAFELGFDHWVTICPLG